MNSMYDSDSNSEQCSLIERYFQPTNNRGTAPTHEKHTIVNATLYIGKTGAEWRMLPNDFPPWQTVYGHYRRVGATRHLGNGN